MLSIGGGAAGGLPQGGGTRLAAPLGTIGGTVAGGGASFGMGLAG